MMTWDGITVLSDDVGGKNGDRLGLFAVQSGKFLEGLKRTTKYVNQDSHPPNRELNPGNSLIYSRNTTFAD
jgi:hypothetical protein